MVLIPFIDERRLVSAMADCEARLDEAARLRNRHGPMQIYDYTETDLGHYAAPAHFDAVVHNHAQVRH